MSTEQQASPAATSIHPGTNIGLVTLRVADLERSRRFYEGILAFQPIELEPGRVVLGSQVGQGDHLVSEALYISDPDDNGLELYRDRPRSEWHWTNGVVQMASDPVDMRGLVEQGER